MSDNDYIPPPRRPAHVDINVPFSKGELVDSHAVADDIARELAEELDDALRLIEWHERGETTVEGTWKPESDALDRYDRVMGSA